MSRSTRQTDSGAYICGPCATKDKRPQVASWPSKTGGRCSACKSYISIGQLVIRVDTGVRKPKEVPTTKPVEKGPCWNGTIYKHDLVIHDNGWVVCERCGWRKF